MLIAENIDKTFKQGSKPVHAVKGAALTVEKGERIYIHGPSGAGKSTLLQVLSGLNRPTGGTVTFGERNIYRLSDVKRSRVRNRSFGFIFQFYHLLPELTVLENVMLPGRMKGGERRRKLKKRALELLNTVHMDARLTHRPSQLSGGESQRTAIARALINSPEVLFCDEPTGNLDSDMSGQIYALVKDISEKNNMSVILVSHQGVEKDFFHKEYHMKDGELATMAAADEVSI
ncbi:MAG: ABC transporter ATP-binding protein [Candidatus Tantalella remota]|nr:ABC transporter ATP-binding protein [Candidatus Tantalella remota]